jgi:DNA-binding CsgD family transcriptional regulator
VLAHLVDRMQCGVIVTSVHAELLFLNTYAKQLVQDGRGLRIRADRLEAVTVRDTKMLRDAVEVCAQADSLPCISFEVSRQGDITPLIVQVAPQPRTSTSVPAATVIVTDPDLPVAVNEGSLRRLFGLTRAESALVSFLLQGKTVEQAAGALFVSIHTVRTHLKRILLKTATGRQSELLRRIMSLSILQLS